MPAKSLQTLSSWIIYNLKLGRFKKNYFLIFSQSAQLSADYKDWA
jgi:hypothetical protein